MTRIGGWLVVLVVVAGCGGKNAESEEARLRVMLDACTKAAVARDYEAMWGHLDSASKAAVEKQMHDMQGLDPKSPTAQGTWEMMRRTFDLGPSDLTGLDARGYFVAMLRGMDRATPGLRGKQVAATRDRTLVDLDVKGTTASARYREPDGTESTYEAVLESGTWKLKADVASGATTKKQ